MKTQKSATNHEYIADKGTKTRNRVHDTKTWVHKTQKDGTLSQRTAP